MEEKLCVLAEEMYLELSRRVDSNAQISIVLALMQDIKTCSIIESQSKGGEG